MPINYAMCRRKSSCYLDLLNVCGRKINASFLLYKNIFVELLRKQRLVYFTSVLSTGHSKFIVEMCLYTVGYAINRNFLING